MKKKSEKKTLPAPVPRLQDMSLSDISRMNVEAIETGNPGPLLDVMRASIEPEPPPLPPAPNYAIELPLLRVGDVPAIGAKLRLVYAGDGPELELELGEHRVTVSLPQLNAAVQAMQAAMYSAPPRPFVVPAPR
jgi:hypothetical protein